MDGCLGLYLCVLSLAINTGSTVTTMDPPSQILSDTSATDDSIDTTTRAVLTTSAAPTSTNFEDTQTSCSSGLQRCQDTFYNSDKTRKQALILVDCVKAVTCEDTDADMGLKRHTLLTSETDALHFDMDDEKNRSRALVTNVGLTITLVICFVTSLYWNTVGKH